MSVCLNNMFLGRRTIFNNMQLCEAKIILQETLYRSEYYCKAIMCIVKYPKHGLMQQYQGHKPLQKHD